MRDEASIKSGYNQPVKEIIIKKTPVFSLNYLHSKKFKSEIKMDSRALFEVLLMKYLHFRKPFYYSRAAIKNDLGINKDRAITIINYLKTIGFLDFKVQTTQLNGSPRQTTYFTVYPENIPNVIDQLMENGDEVIRRLKPFLDSDERIDIGYGYQE
jgi:transcription initiation factor IIE alpha subunit